MFQQFPLSLSLVISIGWGLLFHAQILPAAPIPFQVEKNNRIAFVGNSFADQMRKHGYLETLITVNYPFHRLTFCNLGRPGETVTSRLKPHELKRLDLELSRERVDIIFLCYGMNESFLGSEGLKSFEEHLARLIQHLQAQRYRGENSPKLVLISPVAHEQQLQHPSAEDQARIAEHNKHLKLYTRKMSEVAKQAKIPFVDLFEPTTEFMKDPKYPALTGGGIHLNPLGYWIVAHLIHEGLNANQTGWQLTLNAGTKSVQGIGTVITNVSMNESGIQFSMKDPRLPGPPLPQVVSLPDPYQKKVSRFVASGLKPGRYQLLINDDKVLVAGHDEFASGVIMNSSPAHRQTEKIRALILAKNRLYFQYWRSPRTENQTPERSWEFSEIPPISEKEQLRIEKLNQELKKKVLEIQKENQPVGTQLWKLIPVTQPKAPS